MNLALRSLPKSMCMLSSILRNFETSNGCRDICRHGRKARLSTTLGHQLRRAAPEPRLQRAGILLCEFHFKAFPAVLFFSLHKELHATFSMARILCLAQGGFVLHDSCSANDDRHLCESVGYTWQQQLSLQLLGLLYGRLLFTHDQICSGSY